MFFLHCDITYLGVGGPFNSHGAARQLFLLLLIYRRPITFLLDSCMKTLATLISIKESIS